MAARILVGLLIVIGLWFFGSITPVLAQSPATPSATLPITTQSPLYANLMVINLIHTFSCLAEGASVIGQPCIEYVGQVNQGKPEGLVPGGGALGSIAGFLTALYTTPPTSTVQYLADAGENIGFTKPAQAAELPGSGNKILSPILTLWKLSRNIAYLFMIFIFIIIGFMIMFRQKISQQAVISAQAALPSLVVGLILITFSYFLAALLVDITFVSTHVVAKVVTQEVNTGAKLGKPVNELIETGNVLEIFDNFITPAGVGNVVGTTIGTVKSLGKDGAIGTIIENVNRVGGCLLGTKIAGGSLGGTAGKLASSIFDGIPIADGLGNIVGWAVACAGGSLVAYLSLHSGITGGLVGFILYIVLMIALLIAMFKLLFSLISAYITILIQTIAAPFFFLYGSIPGKQGTVSNWFKTMFANLLAFPAVFAALLFAAYIQSLPNNSFQGTLPLLGGLSSEFLNLLFVYGILLMTPAIPDAIKKAMRVEGQAGPMGAAVGGFMGGAQFGTTTAGTGYKRLWRGGARSGYTARGPIARLAQRRGWYRPPAGEEEPERGP